MCFDQVHLNSILVGGGEGESESEEQRERRHDVFLREGERES